MSSLGATATLILKQLQEYSLQTVSQMCVHNYLATYVMTTAVAILWYAHTGTMTVMKLKALLYRLYKVDSTVQKLSYQDSKVISN